MTTSYYYSSFKNILGNNLEVPIPKQWNQLCQIHGSFPLPEDTVQLLINSDYVDS